MSTPKIKPCTEGARHKWEHSYNIIKKYVNGSHATLSKKGVYLCACGAKKYGEPRDDPNPHRL